MPYDEPPGGHGGFGAPSAPAYREPPHNIEAEQALLGAILQNNNIYDRVAGFLLPEHFANALHGRIFTACHRLIEQGQLASPATLKAYLAEDGMLAEAGGPAYLAQLAAAIATVVNAEDYGRQIHDLALRRRLIDLGEILVNDAFAVDLDRDAQAVATSVALDLDDVLESGPKADRMVAAGLAASTALQRTEAAWRGDRPPGLATGLIDLDKRLGGLHPDNLIILAGRPGMGKTAMAARFALNVARRFRPDPTDEGTVPRAVDGGRVAFFSLEMSAEQLAQRLLSMESGIPGAQLRTGTDLSQVDFVTLADAQQRLDAIPLFIDDTPALTIQQIRARCRKHKRRHGLDLIVIDYLQLLSGGTRVEKRVEEVSIITRGLKALSKELQVPVVALSQLSRAVENREDKRPQLSDLRESGSIEQDADVVMFAFRQEYYLENAEPQQKADESLDKFTGRYTAWAERMNACRNKADVILAKIRYARTGTVTLYFDGATTDFRDLLPDRGGPDQHDFGGGF